MYWVKNTSNEHSAASSYKSSHVFFFHILHVIITETSIWICHVICINSSIHINMMIVKGTHFPTELKLLASTSIASHTQSNHQKSKWISENSHTLNAAAPNGRTSDAKVVAHFNCTIVIACCWCIVYLPPTMWCHRQMNFW